MSILLSNGGGLMRRIIKLNKVPKQLTLIKSKRSLLRRIVYVGKRLLMAVGALATLIFIGRL